MINKEIDSEQKSLDPEEILERFNRIFSLLVEKGVIKNGKEE